MRRSRFFTRSGAWDGGYFEFEIELDSDSHVRRGIVALWEHPDLTGCYAERDIEPEDQARLSPNEIDIDLGYYGIAQLPNGTLHPCIATSVGGCISLGLPMGSLAQAYPVGGYPFGDGQFLQWRTEVERWLRDVAREVFNTVPFELAVFGWECTGVRIEKDFEGGLPSDRRWFGYLVRERDSVKWFPATMGPDEV